MPNQFSNPWTPKDIDFLQNNIGRLTYVQMGMELNRSYSSIQSKIRYLPFQKKVKKHTVNSNFFKKWTPQMAYVLGFIAADGNIYNAGKIYALHIACDDKDVIEKIKIQLSYHGPIYNKSRTNGKTSYHLRICDQIIFKDLESLNITQRKSLTLTPPLIPPHCMRHFIRGFFDGDGSVCVLSRKYPSRLVAVFYTASKNMAVFLHSLMKQELGELYNGSIIERFTNKKIKYYSIALGHKAAQKLYQYMYTNSNLLYMERKYKKFIEGLELYARLI